VYLAVDSSPCKLLTIIYFVQTNHDLDSFSTNTELEEQRLKQFKDAIITPILYRYENFVKAVCILCSIGK